MEFTHLHSLHRVGEEPVSLCAACGLQTTGGDLCPHHHVVYGDDWAAANRILCDLLHRGKVPPRLTPAERNDDFWAATASCE
jgi:hypothetical protein